MDKLTDKYLDRLDKIPLITKVIYLTIFLLIIVGVPRIGEIFNLMKDESSSDETKVQSIETEITFGDSQEIQVKETVMLYAAEPENTVLHGIFRKYGQFQNGNSEFKNVSFTHQGLSGFYEPKVEYKNQLGYIYLGDPNTPLPPGPNSLSVIFQSSGFINALNGEGNDHFIWNMTNKLGLKTEAAVIKLKLPKDITVDHIKIEAYREIKKVDLAKAFTFRDSTTEIIDQSIIKIEQGDESTLRVSLMAPLEGNDDVIVKVDFPPATFRVNTVT